VITTTLGGIDADADLISDVTATSRNVGFGLVSKGNVVSTANNSSEATARIGGNVDITSAAGFDMQARLIGDATGAASGTNAGLAAINTARTDVDFDASVDFTTGQGGSIAATQSINLVGLLNHDGTKFLRTSDGRGAIGSANNVTGGLAAVDSARVDVDSASLLNLTVGRDLSLTSTQGDINISGRHANEAFAAASTASGGAVRVSSATVTANTNGTTTVKFEGDVDNGTDSAADDINVDSVVVSATTSGMSSAGGGLGNFASGNATSGTSHTQNLTFAGLGSVMRIDGDINASALLITDADSAGRVSGGGVISSSSVTTNASATGTVNFVIGNSTRVEAGGDINMKAAHGAAGGDFSDGTIAGSENDDPGGAFPSAGNFINFGKQHLLNDGATVTFTGTSQGGLENGKEYTVIVRNDDTIHLGTKFGGSQVDPTRDTIRIDNHVFEDDDQLFYYSNPTVSTSRGSLYPNSSMPMLRSTIRTHPRTSSVPSKTS